MMRQQTGVREHFSLRQYGFPSRLSRYNWTASTLNGSLKRHNGVIQNDLYAGRIVWNKVRMIKDPDTGKRVSRPNPPSEWQSIDAPHLRIVAQELSERAIALKQERGGSVPWRGSNANSTVSSNPT